ncbi:hypothetical protein Pcinc_003702 [Petrolisthes cinctipes]|uniref:Mutator-like transposase domain-containing protein n=1 Tax=Petrolisthes cinctipes TaxID=88211 RepID=A0AAE1GG90_PETCI|nr:hypothetical protein Pcinc_003702 [Petrolisthes cinctipes]
MVYSNMDIGAGHVGMHKMLGNMSIKPLGKKYQYYQSVVLDAARKKVNDVLANSVRAAKEFYTANDGVYNMKVMFDGSWQKRGHTSNLALGAVIEAEMGLVLDYETVSKFCERCMKKKKILQKKQRSKEGFEKWLVDHKSECQKDFVGSSGAMEAEAAKRLFGRSLQNNVRYTVFITDGDSSAYDVACNLNNGEGPYGDVKIEKGECVSKRLGTAVRKIRSRVVTEKTTKTGKVRRIKDMGGKEKLTDSVIQQLQRYFGIAVRRNVGGRVEELRNDIWYTFLHCSSTDVNRQHHLCPNRKDSWCF